METLTVEQCRALLKAESVGHLAVVTPGGPYVTPISYVYLDGEIAFRTAPGRRSEALRADPRVSIEVSRYDLDTGDWASVVVAGKARILADESEREQVVIAGLLAKYRAAYDTLLALPDEPAVAMVITVAVDEMSGRSSGGMFGPRTRPGRL